MAKTVEGLYYSESHEWVKVEGNIAIVGITDFAQHAMGDLSYVDMPEVDDEVEAGEEFGAVESAYEGGNRMLRALFYGQSYVCKRDKNRAVRARIARHYP